MSDDVPGEADKSAPGQAGPAAADESRGEAVVNPQVVDAIRISNDFVLDQSGRPEGPTAAGVIAYQQVAHAAALAVQDAVDYQRNALSICAAAQGKALAMMAETGVTTPWGEMYGLALMGSLAASVTAAIISEKASEILKEFPRA
jgi:hypothetical protein